MPTHSKPRVLLHLMPGFLLGMTFGFGKIVRDCSLTCNVGYEWAPLAILALSVGALFASALHVRLQAKLGLRKWQALSLVVAAIGFLFFRFATYVAVEGDYQFWIRTIYVAFFVWLGVVGTVLGPNVKASIVQANPEAKRNAALVWSAASVMFGGLVGSLLASWGSGWLTASVGWRYEHIRDTLMIGMGVFLLASVPAALAMRSEIEIETDTSPITSSRPGLVAGFRAIAGNSQASRVATLIVIGGIAESFVLYIFYWLISEQTPSTNGRALFFADFYIWMNAGTLAFLLLGTNRVVDRLGLGFAVLCLPIALSLGTIYLWVQTFVLVIYVLRIVEAVVEDSVYEPGVDRLVLGIDGLDVSTVRSLLQGVVPRIGQGLGAAAVFALATLADVSLRQMIMIYLFILIVWAAQAGFTRKLAP